MHHNRFVPASSAVIDNTPRLLYRTTATAANATDTPTSKPPALAAVSAVTLAAHTTQKNTVLHVCAIATATPRLQQHLFLQDINQAFNNAERCESASQPCIQSLHPNSSSTGLYKMTDASQRCANCARTSWPHAHGTIAHPHFNQAMGSKSIAT